MTAQLDRGAPNLEQIRDGELVLALIIRAAYREDGIRFFTPPAYSQQLAYMNRPAGHRIVPHVHTPVPREVTLTQEVLFVRSGRVQVDLFAADGVPVASAVLVAGDTILLAAGGHGFTMLEQSELIEVKQGPFAGDRDKTPLLVKTGGAP